MRIKPITYLLLGVALVFSLKVKIDAGSCIFIRGDADSSKALSIGDATTIMYFLQGSISLVNLDAADADDDGDVDINDATYVLCYIFGGRNAHKILRLLLPLILKRDVIVLLMN